MTIVENSKVDNLCFKYFLQKNCSTESLITKESKFLKPCKFQHHWDRLDKRGLSLIYSITMSDTSFGGPHQLYLLQLESIRLPCNTWEISIIFFSNNVARQWKSLFVTSRHASKVKILDDNKEIKIPQIFLG